MKTIQIFLFLFLSHTIFAQANLLQSGPMVGYSTMREVLLWVQTKESAEVSFDYWIKGTNRAKVFHTASTMTSKAGAYTAHLVADEVQQGHRYEYELLINKKPVKLPYPTEFQSQELWQYRHDPPTFTVALGSCAYVNEPEYDRPGRPYGSHYEIFTAIHEKRPDAMLWLGDNVYTREGDFTETGFYHRYTHTRSLSEMQPLLASTHNYATWDDHDFGPNDLDASFVHKELALRTFKLFWGNPSYGINGHPSVISNFTFNDMEFFGLDNRYYRSANSRKTGERTMLGEEQLQWLVSRLAESRAPFKFVMVGGQVLNTAAVYENYVRLFPKERERLLTLIEQEGIKGVVFLTGDRHHTELSGYKNKAGNMVYDLTVSSLTAGTPSKLTEKNDHLIDGTVVLTQNFGILTFTGPRKKRVMNIKIFDSMGKELWSKDLKAE